jgi:hypothetical protein
LAQYSQYYIYGRYIARWRVLCGLCNSIAASNGPPTLHQRHAKEEEKKKWPEKVATRFTLIYPSFSCSVQHVSSTVYEKVSSAFFKKEEAK